MNNFFKKIPLKGAILLILTVMAASICSAATPKWQFEIKSQSLYESNIYHSFADSLETAALLNVVDLGLDWHLRQSKQIRHRITAYAKFNLYPNYSNRNQRAVGIVYKPYWRYNQKAKLSLELDLSRRNKDLINDAGQVLSRTLEKWQVDASIRNNYSFGQLKTDISIKYSLDNYDEVAGLTSYDYHTLGGRVRLTYKLSSIFKSRFTFDLEQRNYDARKTYTVQSGAAAGSPFEIRQYTMKFFELSMACLFYRQNEIKLDVDFARRTENFENFYGYDHWQYRLTFDLYPAERHRTTISLRIKNKRYDNYWNSSIGNSNRVWIDYADYQIKHSYQLSQSLKLVGYMRNYNKESNYQATDYLNLTTGLGLEVNL